MKRILISAVLALSLSAVTFAGKLVAEGKSYTTLGDYRIETADNTVPLKGEECKAYVITYENSPMKVTVAICKDRNCKKYVVYSDKLSVQYVCTDKYFGVEKLDKNLERDGYKTFDDELNRVEYFHQKLISRGKQPEVGATQLIAAYFPMLLNNPAESIASR